MPKPKRSLSLNIDLLRPQTHSTKIFGQLVRWGLSAGRYLVIFVEVIVLSAFLFRLKLDTNIADNKDSINQQLPFVKALAGDEAIIRQTQFQLATIKDIKSKQFDFSGILDKISSQTPTGLSISALDINHTTTTALKIVGTSQNNNQVTTLLYGLRTNGFPDAAINSVSLSQGLINFTITATYNGG